MHSFVCFLTLCIFQVHAGLKNKTSNIQRLSHEVYLPFLGSRWIKAPGLRWSWSLPKSQFKTPVGFDSPAKSPTVTRQHMCFEVLRENIGNVASFITCRSIFVYLFLLLYDQEELLLKAYCYSFSFSSLSLWWVLSFIGNNVTEM